MAVRLEYPPGSTPLEAEELDALIPGHITTQGQLDEWETANVAKGMRWARTSRGDLFTEEFCRKLHKAMFGETWEWAGRFRKTDKNIGCSWNRVGIELRKTLDDAKFWMENGTFSIHEIAVQFHHRLVSVHPFPNGNGRFSRAMADILVFRNTSEPLLWTSLGNLANVGEIRKEYISVLKSADNGDYRWLIAFCVPKECRPLKFRCIPEKNR